MNGQSFIHKVNLTFITHSMTTSRHQLSAWKTGECRVPPDFGRGGVEQCHWDTTNSNRARKNAFTDVFRGLDTDFCSFFPEVQGKKIDNICGMTRRTLHSTGTDPAMAQPPDHQGSLDEHFLEYIPEEQIEQPDNSFNLPCSSVAAT